MKVPNNKGYVLVEIILAFAITFALIYFIMDLVINLKNKNDDLLVETLITTDQTIISNRLMEYAITKKGEFDCGELKVSGNTVKYGEDVIDIVSEYGKVGSVSCGKNAGKVSIRIPIEVEQMKDRNFDVVLDYKYDIGDMAVPTCTLSVTSTEVKFASKEDNMEVVAYDINTSGSESYDGNDSLAISNNTFYGYVKDSAGNKGQCSISIINISSSKNCPTGTTLNTDETVCVATKNAKEKWHSEIMCTDLDGGSYTRTCASVCDLCNCSSGYRTSCYPSFNGYYCDAGWTLSGSKCYKNGDPIVNSTCPDGYTKIDDKYCYKLG